MLIFKSPVGAARPSVIEPYSPQLKLQPIHSGMFQISIERTFCAAHSLHFQGAPEPLHGHNFHLTVTLQSPTLDRDGVVVDFHALEHLIDGIIRPWQNANLNEQSPFAPFGKEPGINPSAELIAKVIAEHVQRGLPTLVSGTSPLPTLHSVRLTEAPGCIACYFPPTISQ